MNEPETLSEADDLYRKVRRRRCLSLTLYAVGVGVPIVLLPLLWVYYSKPSMFMYFIFSTMALYTTEAIPVQITALFPLFLLKLMDVDDPAYYLSSPVLLQLASMIMVSAADETAMYSRLMCFLIRRFGSRVRSLLLSLTGTAFLLTILFDSGVTALTMLALCDRAVRMLQYDSIQELQRKSFFRKATQGVPKRLRTLLENYIFDVVTGKPSDIETIRQLRTEKDSPDPEFDSQQDERFARPISTDDDPDDYGDSERANVSTAEDYRHATDITTGASTGLTLSSTFGVETAVSLDVNKSVERIRRSTKAGCKVRFLDEEGNRVYPGESSPPSKPKMRRSIGGLQYPPRIDLVAPLVTRNIFLMEILAWQSSRYYTILRYLVYGVAVTNVVASMVNVTGNSANNFFIQHANKYWRTYHAGIVSYSKWIAVALPVATCSMAVTSFYLHWFLLRNFDAEEDVDTVCTIRDVIAREQELLGPPKVTDYLPMALVVVWMLRMSNFSYTNQSPSEEHVLLEFDYMVIILLFALPTGTWTNPGNLINFHKVVAKLPWGAVIIYGARFAMKACWEEAKFHITMSNCVLAYKTTDPRKAQAFLVGVSSLITEVFGGTDTVILLLPIAAQMASQLRCHPLYLSLPMTLAASTTLILPTSNIVFGIIHDAADIGPRYTIVPGMIIKMTTLLAIIFMSSTVGNYVFHWQHLPKWSVPSNYSEGEKPID